MKTYIGDRKSCEELIKQLTSMNYKETIKALHEEFPQWDLDTLTKVLDCIKENSTYPAWTTNPLVKFEDDKNSGGKITW